MELTIWLAVIAGFVSFISPCVLPLVPAYIGYMGGRMTHKVSMAAVTGPGQIMETGPTVLNRLNTFFHGLFFVIGFTFVFVTIGLLSTAFIGAVSGRDLNMVTDIIGRIGGLIIILFGLHFMGVLPSIFNWLRQHEAIISSAMTTFVFAICGSAALIWSFTGTLMFWQVDIGRVSIWYPILGVGSSLILMFFLFAGEGLSNPQAFWTKLIDWVELGLYTDTRHQMANPGQGGYLGSAILGVVFSAGWTPCIGPVYGAVLTMAASGGNVSQAGMLLTAYSLGLGVPFLLTALMLDGAETVLRRLKNHMRTIELVSGAFLIFIGLMVASGQLQLLSTQFAAQFIEFSISVEETAIQFITGQ